jgi:hypothetical protein
MDSDMLNFTEVTIVKKGKFADSAEGVCLDFVIY